MTRTLNSLVTSQGTAIPESTLCSEHGDEFGEKIVDEASEDTDLARGFVDSTGNPEVRCVICGYPGPVLPLPNEKFGDELVIASIWQNDDAKFGPIFALLMTLASESPYYRVREITWGDGEWICNNVETHHNIVPAVETYVQNGGDH